MAVKKKEVLDEFSSFVPWVESLKQSADDVWRKPIAEGKWSLREILTHIMHWDKNSLEVMVPRMDEGAVLLFVDIEEHNREAEVVAQSYDCLENLIDDVVETRKQLLELLEERYEDDLKLTIDNEEYTYKRFVDIFIHHDAHHRQQVEAFLKQERQV